MGKTAIITDSNCELPDEVIKEYNIGVLPINVFIKGVDYGMTRDFDTYYKELDASHTPPSTTAIPPLKYQTCFESYYDEGYDDLIYIAISSTGSSTYANAFVARSWFNEAHINDERKMTIHLIDSLNYSIAYGYAAVLAAKVRAEGGSVGQMIEAAKEWIDSLEVCLTAFSLEHIRRSGRIGNAMATVGRALGIRPVLKVVKGIFYLIKAVRGNDNAVASVVEYFQKTHEPGTDYVVLRGASDLPALEIIKRLEKITGKPPALYTYIGPLTAINIGPKMTGIGYMVKKA